MDMPDRLARLLYEGSPSTKQTGLPKRNPMASVVESIPWSQAPSDRRAHFSVQATQFLDGDVEAINDPALLGAYERTSGEPGDRLADALAAEIERRGLDI